MIQRIQTVYLLIVAALNLAVVFLPLAVIQSGKTFYVFGASGMSMPEPPHELVYPTWGLMALSAIISLLALVTIFLYKKRILQIRFCIFNTLLMIGFYALFAFSLWEIATVSQPFHFSMRIAVAFPLVSLILNYLAIRQIGADEALVRSLVRLR